MIRTLHRTRGPSALGASRPGDVGPFGPWVSEGDDDDQADEQHDHTEGEAR